MKVFFSSSKIYFKLVLTLTWFDVFLKINVFLLERSSNHGEFPGQKE